MNEPAPEARWAAMDVWVGDVEWSLTVYDDGRLLVSQGAPGAGDEFFVPEEVAWSIAESYDELHSLARARRAAPGPFGMDEVRRRS